MDQTKNYYGLLGVIPSAEPIVIRAAYRALAMKYHPDKWIGDRATAERKMHEINEAFEILSNEQSRMHYDSVRQRNDFEEYEFETETTQDAFQDAEREQRSDWSFAVEYYPDLDTICADLRRTSNRLAFAFRTTILETKQYSQRKEIAQKLEIKFLQSYFGENPRIIEFARELIENGHKEAAKELNRAISVFGRGADQHVVIRRIRERYLGKTTALKAAEAAENLLKTRYVSDARQLIEQLHGTIKMDRVAWWQNSEIYVSVLGAEGRFQSDYDMVQWIVRTIVPKIITDRWASAWRRITSVHEPCTDQSLSILRKAEANGFSITIGDDNTFTVTKVGVGTSYLRSNFDIVGFGRIHRLGD
jgi:curved DNA-binding protein CbpA